MRWDKAPSQKALMKQARRVGLDADCMEKRDGRGWEKFHAGDLIIRANKERLITDCRKACVLAMKRAMYANNKPQIRELKESIGKRYGEGRHYMLTAWLR